ATLSEPDRFKVRLSQGRPPFGVTLRITDQENGTHELDRDGHTTGTLQIKGHWIINHYLGKSSSALPSDGWFATGDIASLAQDGYL
ncbi:long-chain fatty acid--CoA ligase, partial [Acinetobacter gerneri]